MPVVNLSKYDSSNGTITIDDSISSAKDNVLSLTSLSKKVNINNEFITTDKNIFETYKNYLDQFCVYLEITEEYFYKPDYVSYRLYGTTDLWYLVMWTSRIPSVGEFTQKVIRVFNPARIDILNAILNREYKTVETNNKDPEVVPNYILKPVKIKDTRYF